MNKINVRVIAEIAILAALGFALDALQGGIWKGAFPNGGSIGLAMVPVFVIAYRRGLVAGVLCGVVLSLVNLLQGVYVINSGSLEGWKSTAGPYIQVALDYIVTYPLVGVAGAFAGLYKKTSTKGMKVCWIIVGCVVGGMLKYFAHALAGVFFWPGKLWGVSGAAYSWLYNGLYSIPNIIICTALMVLIALFYPMFLNPEGQKAKNEEQEQEENAQEVAD